MPELSVVIAGFLLGLLLTTLVSVWSWRRGGFRAVVIFAGLWGVVLGMLGVLGSVGSTLNGNAEAELAAADLFGWVSFLVVFVSFAGTFAAILFVQREIAAAASKIAAAVILILEIIALVILAISLWGGADWLIILVGLVPVAFFWLGGLLAQEASDSGR